MKSESASSIMTMVATVSAMLLLLLSLQASADCPSNGNTHAIYVTSNMGDNIWSFDTHGAYIGEVINTASFPADVKVDKLRTMRFGPGNHLYVTSARGSYSRVFAVSGNGLLNHTLQPNCTRQYLFTVVKQDAQNPLLDHPYDMVFHPESDALFVSNQNSMTITKYIRSAPAASSPSGGGGGGGADYPQWVPAPNVKDAVPVDSSVTLDTGVEKPISIPENSGLFASTWSSSYSMSSVRGVALSPRLPRALVDGTAPAGLFSTDHNSTMAYYLLVCDVAMNMVHVFDPETGIRLFGLPVPSPIQVSFPTRYYNAAPEQNNASSTSSWFPLPYIYVTSKDDGMAYMLRFTSHSGVVQASDTQIFTEDYVRSHRLFAITKPAPLHAASGLYENPSRDILLIADRNGRKISSYASPFLGDYTHASGPSPFLGWFVRQLPDQPEFIISALLENQRNIPFCYELSRDGRLRYVALCSAAYVWSIALMVVVTVVPLFLIYRQVQACLRDSEKKSKKKGDGRSSDEDDAAAGLLSADAPLLGARSNTHYGT